MKKFWAAFFLFSSFTATQVEAGELLASARPHDGQRWNVQLFHTSLFDQDVILSPGSNDLESEGEGGSALLKVTVQPWDHLQYFVKVGQSHYELWVPSDTVRNQHEGRPDGLVYGAGVKALLFPDTIMSPALAVEASLTKSSYRFRRLNQTTAVDEDFELLDYQFSVEMSKRWKRLEPYGGVKMRRLVSTLRDRGTENQVSGRQESVSPFAGTEIALYQHEFLVVEGTFVKELSVSVGLSVHF